MLFRGGEQVACLNGSDTNGIVFRLMHSHSISNAAESYTHPHTHHGTGKRKKEKRHVRKERSTATAPKISSPSQIPLLTPRVGRSGASAPSAAVRPLLFLSPLPSLLSCPPVYIIYRPSPTQEASVFLVPNRVVKLSSSSSSHEPLQVHMIFPLPLLISTSRRSPWPPSFSW